jgi:hypothetical protein
MTDLVNEETVVKEPLNAETVVNEPVTEETVVNEPVTEETVVKEQPKEETVVNEQPKEEEKKPVIREKSQNELKAEQRIADTKVKENIKAKFNAITANATMAPYFKDIKPSDRMKSMTKNVLFDVFYNHAAEYIGEMWEATGNNNPALLQKVMADKSNEMFYRAESALAQFGLSTEERFAAAQKMTDMMINRFSPVAFDKNLETFGDAYFLKHTSKDEIGTLAKTDDFSVQRRVWTIALNDIRDSKEQLDLSAEFEESEEIKAPKIEDRNELSKNRVKE